MQTYATEKAARAAATKAGSTLPDTLIITAIDTHAADGGFGASITFDNLATDMSPELHTLFEPFGLNFKDPSMEPNETEQPAEPAAAAAAEPKPERVAQNGITQPNGLKMRRIWDIADEITKQHADAGAPRPATRAEVQTAAQAEGQSKNCVDSQYGFWAQFHGIDLHAINAERERAKFEEKLAARIAAQSEKNAARVAGKAAKIAERETKAAEKQAEKERAAAEKTAAKAAAAEAKAAEKAAKEKAKADAAAAKAAAEAEKAKLAADAAAAKTAPAGEPTSAPAPDFNPDAAPDAE